MARFERTNMVWPRALTVVVMTIAAATFTLFGYRLALLGTPALASEQGGVTSADGVGLPQGYRDWPLISVAAVGSPVNDVRAKLGNDIAIADFRRGTIPYRDGAIIARLAWHQSHDQQTGDAIGVQARALGLNEEAIAKLLSGTSVAGAPINVQIMVKDSKKFASTGGWGFAQFTNGKADSIVQTSCFSCHAPAKAVDFVFTRYAQ